MNETSGLLLASGGHGARRHLLRRPLVDGAPGRVFTAARALVLGSLLAADGRCALVGFYFVAQGELATAAGRACWVFMARVAVMVTRLSRSTKGGHHAP